MSDSLETRVARARGALREPEFDEVRLARSLAQSRARLAADRQRRRRLALAAAASVLLAVGAGAFFAGRAEPEPLASPGAPPEGGAAELRLADGSRARPLGSDTILTLESDAPGESELHLGAGAARFEVVPDPSRRFVVRAGDVTVSVLGTVFTVARGQGGRRVEVAVRRGRVRVRWPTGEAELGAGESGWFPREDDDEATSAPEASASPGAAAGPGEPAGATAIEATAIEATAIEATGDAERAGAEGGASPGPAASEPPSAGRDRAGPPARRGAGAPAPRWRALAAEGEFEQAYEALQRTGELPRDRPAELLLAADVARMSGHPRDAVAPLRRVLARHRSDPRAALAAFTLGRVYLDELGRPQEAARVFAEARRIRPAGPMAEDALAREVEAWARAGRTQEARARAREFVARYPDGARVRLVRRLGELE